MVIDISAELRYAFINTFRIKKQILFTIRSSFNIIALGEVTDILRILTMLEKQFAKSKLRF